MKRKTRSHTRLFTLLMAMALLIGTLSGIGVPAAAAGVPGTTGISEFKVCALDAPLGIDSTTPDFSWSLQSNIMGQKQTAYQLVVKTDTGAAVWDTGKVAGGVSNGILYAGAALTPETDYVCDLTVWDAFGNKLAKQTRFSTGMMDPDIAAWDGAQWIGNNELILDAASSMVWNISTTFQIRSGDNISFIFGANDPRLTDPYQNQFGAPGGENFIRFELDLSGVSSTGALLNVYRKGYHKSDAIGGDPNALPFKTFNFSAAANDNIKNLFTADNKNAPHTFSLTANGSALTLAIDNVTIGGTGFAVVLGSGRTGQTNNLNVSPYSYFGDSGVETFQTSGDYPTYPQLNSVGFQVKGVGDEVTLTDYRIVDSGQSTRKDLFGYNTGAKYGIFAALPNAGITASANTLTIKPLVAAEVGPKYADPSYGSQPMLRTEFATDTGKTIAKARLYVTAQGAYELFINGARMSNDWFNPGMSVYRKTLTYHTYDVTGMLQSGDNAIGATLGQGFWSGYMTFTLGNFRYFGDTEALLIKLVVTYSDGMTKTVVTDPGTWKVFGDGPVRNGSTLQGQRYDAAREAAVRGYATVAYDDAAWKTPTVIAFKDARIDPDLVARRDTPVHPVETLTAQKTLFTHSADGKTWTYDMGVNMVGVPSVTIPAGSLRRGDVVLFRFGEVVYPGNEDSPNTVHPDGYTYASLYGPEGTYRPNMAGRVLTETYRGAMSADFYVASAEDETRDVVIEPHFTYHGYRYIQITVPGRTTALPTGNVKGIALSSLNGVTGTYDAVTTGSSGDLVDQLFKNIQRSQLGNYFSIPTDCPQRNERMGWTGDAQVYSRTASYNADIQGFMRQWMVAQRQDQGVGSATAPPGGVGNTIPRYALTDDLSFASSPTWGASVVMVPWQLYQQYGDLTQVSENFNAMRLWMEGYNDERYRITGYPGLSMQTGGLADHVSLDARTPSQLCNNAILVYMMGALAVMADAVGETDYAVALRARQTQAIDSWSRVYVDPNTGMTRGATLAAGGVTTLAVVDSQTSYCTPLNFGCFSDTMTIQSGPNAGMTYKDFAVKRLAELCANPALSGNGQGPSRGNYGVNNGTPHTLSTGFSGTPNLLPALTKNGQITEAYDMIEQSAYASWLYPITLGATTQWELWNAYEVAFGKSGNSQMNSQNHFALGGVGEWMYEYQLGITSGGAAGYQDYVLQPLPGGDYASLSGSFASNYGKIVSEWTATEGVLDTYHTEVPANTTATLYLPIPAGAPVQTIRYAEFLGYSTRNGVSVAKFKLASGGFDFAFESGGSGGGSGGARRLVVRQSADYANGIVSSIKPFPVVVASLKKGRTLQLNPVCEPAYIAVPAGGFEYSSLNTTVATVDSNGLVTAKKAGMTAIVVKALDGSGVKGMVTITVVS